MKRVEHLHVCVPNYRGLVETPFHTSILSLFHFFGTRRDHVQYVQPTHTVVATARQTCVEAALSSPRCSHVLFIDDDMVFGPEQYLALEREMLDNDLDFLGALAFSNSVPTKPCVFGEHPVIPAWGDKPWWYILTDYPLRQRFEVAATGFGMALISRRLLQALSNQFVFEMPEGFDGLDMFTFPGVRNEDVAFCLRARKAGFKLWVDSRVAIGHISKDRPVIDEATYRAQGLAPEYHLGIKRARLVPGTVTAEFIEDVQKSA